MKVNKVFSQRSVTVQNGYGLSIHQKKEENIEKRLTILVAVLLLFSFALFACSSNDPGEGSGEALSPKHGGTLRIAIDTTTALDPTFLTTSGDNQAAAMWNDYLVFVMRMDVLILSAV